MLERDAQYSCNEVSFHVCVYICRLSEHKQQTQLGTNQLLGQFRLPP